MSSSAVEVAEMIGYVADKQLFCAKTAEVVTTNEKQVPTMTIIERIENIVGFTEGLGNYPRYSIT